MVVVAYRGFGHALCFIFWCLFYCLLGRASLSLSLSLSLDICSFLGHGSVCLSVCLSLSLSLRLSLVFDICGLPEENIILFYHFLCELWLP